MMIIYREGLFGSTKVLFKHIYLLYSLLKIKNKIYTLHTHLNTKTNLLKLISYVINNFFMNSLQLFTNRLVKNMKLKLNLLSIEQTCLICMIIIVAVKQKSIQMCK